MADRRAFVAAEGRLAPFHIVSARRRRQGRCMDDMLSTLTFAALTFLLGGFIKGVIGVGLPTVAMGLLTLVLRPVQAAALLIAPTLATNIWQATAGPRITVLLR